MTAHSRPSSRPSAARAGIHRAADAAGEMGPGSRGLRPLGRDDSGVLTALIHYALRLSVSRPRSRGAFLRPRFQAERTQERRARGTPGPRGTRGLAPLARRKRSDAFRKSAARFVVTASPPTLRRPARGVSKPALHDPRWPLLFRLPSLSGAEASPPLRGYRQRLADGNRRTALPP